MAPMAFLQTLKQYYSKADDQPIISSKTAAALSITFTALYVLPFYLSPLTRPSPNLPRDSPSVIRARIRSVTLSCVLSSVITIYILATYAHFPPLKILRQLGWFPITIPEIAKPLLLTVVLFAGPLFERAIIEGGWSKWIRGQPFLDCLSSWTGWRNFVAGPITEELVFRSILLSLALLSVSNNASTSSHHLKTILLTPLYFGIAHIHHFYEFILTHQRTPLAPALAITLFQFSYTVIFGWYASFVFLRTGSLVAVVLCHSFCNWMGLPRLWGHVGHEVVLAEGSARGQGTGALAGIEQETVMGERSGGAVGRTSLHARRMGQGPQADEIGSLAVGWTAAYYGFLMAGAILFWQLFWVLTRSESSLVDWRGW